MRVDVTTTATIRPNIHRLTFRSFTRNLLRGHDARLILNVDPIGDKGKTITDVLSVVKDYFQHTVVNHPVTANFPMALKWCWQQVETEFFFNLEDDWRLVRSLDLDDMVRVMKKYPRLALLRLPKGETTDAECEVYSTPSIGRYAWNGDYFEAPTGVRSGYAGMPSLIRTSWMRAWVDDLRQDLNHERCWKSMAKRGDPRATGWAYGAYAPRDAELTVVDVGRNYRQVYGIERNSRTNLTQWIDKNGKQM